MTVTAETIVLGDEGVRVGDGVVVTDGSEVVY